MERRFYTIKDLSEILGVSYFWLKKRVKTGEIPSYKIGGKRLFKKAEIEQWIESRKEVVSK